MPGEVLVKFKKSSINLSSAKGKDSIHVLSSDNDLQLKELISENNVAVFYNDRKDDITSTIESLLQNPNIEYAQPNYIYYPQSKPNDEHYSSLCAFNRISWEPAMSLYDAYVTPTTWNNSGTIAAVIDVWVDYMHPDLIDNMRDGTNCVSETWLFIGGCANGYDFIDYDKSPFPTYSSHGTHVAWTIGAVMNNNILWVVGINPHARIMVLRAIYFAINNGAKVINASFGGMGRSNMMQQAIMDFGKAGELFVAGAWNNSSDHAYRPFYPCDLNLDNMIYVGSVWGADDVSYFSDWWVDTVHVAAPGEWILSTTLGIATRSGTESFESIWTWELPSWFTKTPWENTRWVSFRSDASTKVLSSTQTESYTANNNFSVEQLSDLSGVLSAQVYFNVWCDTQYDRSDWRDYLSVSFSPNGTDFEEIQKIDEIRIDVKKWYTMDGVGTSVYNWFGIDIPSRFQSTWFTLRFTWISPWMRKSILCKTYYSTQNSRNYQEYRS